MSVTDSTAVSSGQAAATDTAAPGLAAEAETASDSGSDASDDPQDQPQGGQSAADVEESSDKKKKKKNKNKKKKAKKPAAATVSDAVDESSQSQSQSQQTQTKPPSKGMPKGQHPEKPFTALRDGIWLHNRPKEDTFQLLIDSYRMRAQDEFHLEGHKGRASIYAHREHSRVPMGQFLDLCKEQPGLLPSWWTNESKEECLDYGMNDGWASLYKQVDKNGIIEHYGDSYMPMKLRMLAEKVFGRAIMNQPGTGMLMMMCAQEGGGGGEDRVHSLFDVQSLLAALGAGGGPAGPRTSTFRHGYSR